MGDGKWVTMGDNANVPHPKCIGSQKKTQYGTKNLSKGAKSKVGFSPTSKTSHCVRTACMAFPYTSHRFGGHFFRGMTQPLFGATTGSQECHLAFLTTHTHTHTHKIQLEQR